MRWMAPIVVLVAALAVLPGSAIADAFFMANLDGGQEVPPNVSPGSGTAAVDLTTAGNPISVTLDWQDLLAGATAATINQDLPGTTGPVLFSPRSAMEPGRRPARSIRALRHSPSPRPE
jgi:hypothetical protein